MSSVAEALDRELRGFSIRLRDAPLRWFAAAATPFGTREDAAFHLVRRIARAAFDEEFDGLAMPVLPRLTALSLADQLDVVRHDLFALADLSDAVAGPLLAEVLLHRWHVDGSAPGPSASALAASATGEDGVAGWQRLCDRDGAQSVAADGPDDAPHSVGQGGDHD